MHTQTPDELREAFHFTERGDCVLAGRSMRNDLNVRHRFALVLLAAGGGVLAFGLGVGWWLTTRAIRPVEEISAAASRISAGNLSERVTVRDAANELGQLASVLNSTFARLDAAFARQKQFTADARTNSARPSPSLFPKRRRLCRASGAPLNIAKPSKPVWTPRSKCGGSRNRSWNSRGSTPARKASSANVLISRNKPAHQSIWSAPWPTNAA
jgi:HAMP domain-containing protein